MVQARAGSQDGPQGFDDAGYRRGRCRRAFRRLEELVATGNDLERTAPRGKLDGNVLACIELLPDGVGRLGTGSLGDDLATLLAASMKKISGNLWLDADAVDHSRQIIDVTPCEL